MTHETPLDVLRDGTNSVPAAIPAAILRVAQSHKVGITGSLGTDAYRAADAAFKEVGWWRDEPQDLADSDPEIEGVPYCPFAVLERCEAHPDWDQFIETWGDMDSLGNSEDDHADTIYFAAWYVFAHQRKLL